MDMHDGEEEGHLIIFRTGFISEGEEYHLIIFRMNFTLGGEEYYCNQEN